MNFKKFHLKWKAAKHFRRLKQRATLRKSFSLHQPPTPPDKILLNLWNKITFITEIYRHLFSKCSKKVVLGRQEMLQCKWSYWSPNRNIFAGKFVNWQSLLAVFWEHVISSFKRVEIHKMSEIFWMKLYCKMSDLCGWFLLALRFSAINSGIKKLWWCPPERLE